MATITEGYVSFEVSKLLKENGFDWKTYDFYEVEYGQPIKKHSQRYAPVDWNGEDAENCYSAPTQSMAMKWLREVHKLHIEPHIQSYKNYNGNIYNLDGELLLGFPSKSSEQACEAAIKYCLIHLI